MGFLRRIGQTLALLDDRDVIQILMKISENGPIRTLDLQRRSGVLKDATFYAILKDLEDAGLIQKKVNGNKSVEYSITGLYNVCRIDKWIDGTYRGQFEADFFKNLVLRLKLEYERV